MKTLIVILITSKGLLYHPVPYQKGMGCLDSFEYWREKNTTHTWEKIKGDPMSHGDYINEGVLEGLRVIATYCPDN